MSRPKSVRFLVPHTAKSDFTAQMNSLHLEMKVKVKAEPYNSIHQLVKCSLITAQSSCGVS